MTAATSTMEAKLCLDHLTVVAPSLADGVDHIRACLDIDIPFGQRHDYMGTHNHLLQLGGSVYLEIIAVDPAATPPAWPRWFGLDDAHGVRAAWESGRRLRGWVARSSNIDATLSGHANLFGTKLGLPPAAPVFDFSLRQDGALPLDGAAPCIIDRRGKTRNMATIPDLGARLASFVLEHPDPAMVAALYRNLNLDHAPTITCGAVARYRAEIELPGGLKRLT